MKVSIQPTTLPVPGRGNVNANLLEVRVAHHELNVRAVAFYDIQKRTVIPAVPEVPAVTDEQGNITTPAVPAVPEQVIDESFGYSGNIPLTSQQFAAWGEDDLHFVAAVAQNLGLTLSS